MWEFKTQMVNNFFHHTPLIVVLLYKPGLKHMTLP